jgi:hypothetical protein
MSNLKSRLIRLEERRMAKAGQQHMRYAGDNPMQRYLAMLNDKAYIPQNAPQGCMSPKEAYAWMCA